MVVWIIWLIVGGAAILCFTALIVPKIMARMYAATLTVRTKAVERYRNEFGDVLVYVPSRASREYIKRYSISRDENGLYFCGEFSKKVAFLEYELTIFNSENEIIQVLRVEEMFNDSGETSKIRLPEKTDYVGLSVRCVDDDPIPVERRLSLRYCGWLAILCACLAGASDLLVWLIVSFILHCRDKFTMTLTLPSSAWASLLCYTALGVVAIVCCLCLGSFLIRGKGDSDEQG